MEQSEFFHPLLTRFRFQLVEQKKSDEDFVRSLYRREENTILVTEGKFGAYWQAETQLGYWCTLEEYLNLLEEKSSRQS